MSGAVCHADRGAGTDTALWIDADSRKENRRLWQHSGIRDVGSNLVCDVRPMLGESLLRRLVKVSSESSVLNRQVANPAAAHPAYFTKVQKYIAALQWATTSNTPK